MTGVFAEPAMNPAPEVDGVGMTVTEIQSVTTGQPE